MKDSNARDAVVASLKICLGEPLPAFLTRKELEATGLRGLASLERDAVHGGGIPCIQSSKSGSARYPLAAVVEWAAARLRISTTAGSKTSI